VKEEHSEIERGGFAMLSSPRAFVHLAVVLAAISLSIQAQEVRDRQLTQAYDFSKVQMPVEIVSIKFNGKEIHPGEKIQANDEWLRSVSFRLKNISDQPIAYMNIAFKFPIPNGFVVATVLNYGVDTSRLEPRRSSSPPAIQPGNSHEFVFTKERYDSFLHVLAQANAPKNFDTASFYIERVCFENQPDVIWQDGYLKRRHATDFGRFDVIQKYFLPQRAGTTESKFLRTGKNVIPNQYIVVLTDDVVSSSAPLEVRRERITAVANRHAQAYGGKVRFIYETAVKGYSIELPNETAAIALSKLPQVKYVEQNTMGSW
jgi:hypothetical protein